MGVQCRVRYCRSPRQGAVRGVLLRGRDEAAGPAAERPEADLFWPNKLRKPMVVQCLKLSRSVSSALSPFFFWGRVPLLKSTTERKLVPTYSKLSEGASSFARLPRKAKPLERAQGISRGSLVEDPTVERLNGRQRNPWEGRGGGWGRFRGFSGGWAVLVTGLGSVPGLSGDLIFLALNQNTLVCRFNPTGWLFLLLSLSGWRISCPWISTSIRGNLVFAVILQLALEGNISLQEDWRPTKDKAQKKRAVAGANPGSWLFVALAQPLLRSGRHPNAFGRPSFPAESSGVHGSPPACWCRPRLFHHLVGQYVDTTAGAVLVSACVQSQ